MFHSSDVFLIKGSLKQVTRPVGQLPILAEAAEMINANWEYRHTSAYHAYLEAIRSGHPLRRQQIVLDSAEKVEVYFKRFRRLHDSILRHGFLPNRAVKARTGEPPDRELGIALGPDRSFIKLPGGQHRFALATALGIRLVPVEIRMIHADLVHTECVRTGVTADDAILAILHDTRCSISNLDEGLREVSGQGAGAR